MVWLDEGTGAFGDIDIYGARMRPDGALLDGPPNSGGIPISISTPTPPGSTPPLKDHPRAAFDGFPDDVPVANRRYLEDALKSIAYSPGNTH